MANGPERAALQRSCGRLSFVTSSVRVLNRGLLFARIGQYEAPARCVEVEDFGVTSPRDCRLKLPHALFLAELLVEHVEEEVFRYGVVALGFERAANLPEQQNIADRRVAEQFLLPKDLRICELFTLRRNGCVAFLDLQEAEQLRGFHDRQQVVDLERKVIGEAENVIAA